MNKSEFLNSFYSPNKSIQISRLNYTLINLRKIVISHCLDYLRTDSTREEYQQVCKLIGVEEGKNTMTETKSEPTVGEGCEFTPQDKREVALRMDVEKLKSELGKVQDMESFYKAEWEHSKEALTAAQERVAELSKGTIIVENHRLKLALEKAQEHEMELVAAFKERLTDFVARL